MEYSIKILEKEINRIKDNLKDWDVEDYVRYLDEHDELKSKVVELEQSIKVLKEIANV